MKSLTQYLSMHVNERMGFENITREVAKAVRESGVGEGLCLVNAMHITASVFINDDETGLHEDYRGGWSSWRRSTPAPSATTTTGRVKTMLTPITSGRSWAEKSWWQ